MITSKDDLVNGQELTADICIIGGGPAAISMALSYAATDYKVILITGGLPAAAGPKPRQIAVYTRE